MNDIENLNSQDVVSEQRRFLEKEGIVYRQVFVDLEKQDNRKKVVFDLDNTLVSNEKDIGNVKLRENVKETLDILSSDPNIKLILWTGSTRDRTESVLKKFSLGKYFDLVITRENYDLVHYRSTAEKGEFLQKYESVYRMQEDYGAQKPLYLLGYGLLVEDLIPNIAVFQRETGVVTINSGYFQPSTRFDRDSAPLKEEIVYDIRDKLNI